MQKVRNNNYWSILLTGYDNNLSVPECLPFHMLWSRQRWVVAFNCTSTPRQLWVRFPSSSSTSSTTSSSSDDDADSDDSWRTGELDLPSGAAVARRGCDWGRSGRLDSGSTAAGTDGGSTVSYVSGGGGDRGGSVTDSSTTLTVSSEYSTCWSPSSGMSADCRSVSRQNSLSPRVHKKVYAGGQFF